MTADTGRARDRAGGTAALLAAAAGVAVVGLRIAAAFPGLGEAVRSGPVLSLLALVSALAGVTLAVAALAADGRLRPASWVTRLAAGGAGAGALLWMAGGLALLFGGGGLSGTPGLLLELAPVGTGVWALAAAAAAWKLRVWPAWLRVTGAVFGGAAMVQPGLPPLALIALLAGLAWWIGLGVVLLRGPRSTRG